ncbi:IS3 family transposase [Streptomyces sp. NPDC047461]|uniref:IS3 family transposase n=1 Tax=Streptomyces sp. NPDC047461 TaxID=3155619 RepID=UPI0033CD2A65
MKRLCTILGIARSSFYYWRRTAADRAARQAADARLAARLRAAHHGSGGTYGVPRITAELRDDGERINHKRITLTVGVDAGMHSALACGLRPTNSQDLRRHARPSVRRRIPVREHLSRQQLATMLNQDREHAPCRNQIPVGLPHDRPDISPTHSPTHDRPGPVAHAARP